MPFSGCALHGNSSDVHQVKIHIENWGLKLTTYMNVVGQIDSLNGIDVVETKPEAEIILKLSPIQAVESPTEVRVEESDAETGEVISAGICSTPKEGFGWLACAKSGWYQLKSRPLGAKVMLDGKFIGTTPFIIKLNPGTSYEVEMSFGRKKRAEATLLAEESGKLNLQIMDKSLQKKTEDNRTIVQKVHDTSGPFIIVGLVLGLATLGFLLKSMIIN